MEPDELHNLEKSISYQFINPDLPAEALRHSSFVNEQTTIGLRDNERFEFLGDAVLNLVIGNLLMEKYPDLREGDLSRMRANLVNESTLASIARTVELGKFIQLGRGEIQTHGQDKNSILADAFEALIAAIYLDNGFEAAFAFIAGRFQTRLSSIIHSSSNHDYKSRLQELAQFTCKSTPQYKIIKESGPDHDKVFNVRLTIQGLNAEGRGKSKKSAEQDAARQALELLELEE
ncbi:MAG: ribonuclease III [Desulfobacteraceae bacterium 4572_123]|nr:MAG: ribonuclease III [Desulfobacteraceae bacterium 4572_123]